MPKIKIQCSFRLTLKAYNFSNEKEDNETNLTEFSGLIFKLQPDIL